jgi:hypothetical protein
LQFFAEVRWYAQNWEVGVIAKEGWALKLNEYEQIYETSQTDVIPAESIISLAKVWRDDGGEKFEEGPNFKVEKFYDGATKGFIPLPKER